jgi:signal recognition particle subunit SRP54
VLLDTAGRLHIDEAMIEELKVLRREVKPHHVLLVVDAMSGQDAVTMAQRFQQEVGYDGVVLTKLDGDARGGAALSIRAVTGKPIVFCGVGERVDALEPFHPDRMASRILGLGDVLTLIEKVEAQVGEDSARRIAERGAAGEFTLEDLRDQLASMKKMGPLSSLVDLLPRGGAFRGLSAPESVDENALTRVTAIIDSMTAEERRYPQVLNGSRKKRVAAGSGTSVAEINRLLKQYQQMRKLMKMARKGARGMDLSRLPLPPPKG